MNPRLGMLLTLLGIAAVVFFLANSTPGTAQATSSSTFDTFPPQMVGKNIVLRPGTPIDGILKAFLQEKYTGAAFSGYSSTGSLYFFVDNGQSRLHIPPVANRRLYVYERADGTVDSINELDCDGGEWGVWTGYYEYIEEDIPSGLTIDDFLARNCGGESGLDREAQYTFDEDLWIIGEQYLKDALKKGDEMINDLKIPLSQTTNTSLIASSTLITNQQADTAGTLNCTNTKIYAGSTNGIWKITGAMTRLEHTSTNPYCIQFDGPTSYLLEVWRFAPFPTSDTSMDYYKLGARLFYRNSSGQWTNAWNNVQYSDRYVMSGGSPVKATENTQIGELALVRGTTGTEFGTSNIMFTDQEGKLATIVYKLTKNDGLTITQLGAMSHSTLSQNDHFRFRFEAAIETTIQEALDKPGYDIYEDKDNLIDVSLARNSNTTLKIQEYPINSTIAANTKHFVTGTAIVPGKYQMRLQIAGFKDIFLDMVLDREDFTLGDDTKTTADKIRTVVLPLELTPDPCGKCVDVTTCLACVDSEIVQSYTP